MSNTVKFEAFKKVGQEQITAIQDAFAKVFEGVRNAMDIQDLPANAQAKSIA